MASSSVYPTDTLSSAWSIVEFSEDEGEGFIITFGPAASNATHLHLIVPAECDLVDDHFPIMHLMGLEDQDIDGIVERFPKLEVLLVELNYATEDSWRMPPVMKLRAVKNLIRLMMNFEWEQEVEVYFVLTDRVEVEILDEAIDEPTKPSGSRVTQNRGRYDFAGKTDKT